MITILRREDPMHSALLHRLRPRLHGRAAAGLVCALATTEGCSDRSIAKDASASSDTSDSSDEDSSTDGASETTTATTDVAACHDEPLEPGDGIDHSPCHTAASFPCSSCDEWCAAVGRECAYTAVIMGECPAYVPGPPNITCATPSFGSFQCACQGGEPQPTYCDAQIPDQAAGWWLSGCCEEEVSCVAWCAEQGLGECVHVLLYVDEACAEPWLFAMQCEAAGGVQGPRQCVCEP